MKYTEMCYEENVCLLEAGVLMRWVCFSILFSAYLALRAMGNVAWIPMLMNALGYIFEEVLISTALC